MSDVFDPHNVKFMEMNGDGVVDEMDYKTLLLLYDYAIKKAAIYKTAFEDVDHHRDGHAPTRESTAPANARLIAAAPELLEALKSLVDACDGNYQELTEECNLLIAKAEGR
jgi:hypothetical protein